jgi:F0F1-type ATP synthase membrane subunit b/b'
MSISSATKSLTDDIEASFETRAAEISDIVRETHQTLENFKQERQEMAASLRRDLSASERERRQEFVALIGNIKDELVSIEKDTTQMLADFEQRRRQEFAGFQRDLRNQINGMLADHSADRRQAHAHWENLTRATTAKRTGN